MAVVAVAALLLAAMPSARALPPRAHSIHGMVQAIEFDSRSLTLKPRDGGTPLKFAWNDDTRFSGRGCCARCSLNPGQDVRVSYRRELGRNVLREVSTPGASACRGAANK